MCADRRYAEGQEEKSGGIEMNIVRIRNSINHELYFGADNWDLNRKCAREFATAPEAIAFVLQQRLDNAELVMHNLGSTAGEVALGISHTRSAFLPAPRSSGES